MLIPVNIVQHHWFLLQVNFISNIIIVYDSIIRDPSVDYYVDYFRRLEMWLNYAVVPIRAWSREISTNVLRQPVEEGDNSCAIYTILNIVSIVCEVIFLIMYIYISMYCNKLQHCSELLLYCCKSLLRFSYNNFISFSIHYY